MPAKGLFSERRVAGLKAAISEPISFTKETFLQKLPLVLKAVEALGKGSYEILIKEHRKKRSLNANAYAWELIGALAENQGIDKEEVYRAPYPTDWCVPTSRDQ